MNREIKFRAWNIEESKMFSNDETAIYAFSEKFGEPAEMTLREINRVFKKNDYISWMQFTGIKDKNGLNELYEYDIIDINGLMIGNFYENKDLLSEKSNFLIESMGEEKWKNTEQEANKRGCNYAK